VPAHGVTCYGNARGVEFGEGGVEGGGEFAGDVGLHFVAAGPGGAGCIEVETGAGAEVVGFVFAFDFESAWLSQLVILLWFWGEREGYVVRYQGIR
jgi:hypothetical protein